MTRSASRHFTWERAADHSLTESAAARINARLDPQTAAELDSLVRAGGQTVTDVIKTAIHFYYRQQAQRAGRAALDLFRSSGLIGCADGPADLSSRYKDYLGDGLAEKHGLK